ncbi:MAG: SH3 domain-containing protein [Candidatus Abawacabacteria bacterium]|nr:SH3 domain-containing protein [Candidatus Abawacabacteria bacterium]
MLTSNVALASCGCHLVLKNANVRSLPSVQGKVIDVLDKGMHVEVLEETNQWCKIAYTMDKPAYVYCPLLEPIANEEHHDNSEDTDYEGWNDGEDDYGYSDDEPDYLNTEWNNLSADDTPCNAVTESCSSTFKASVTGNMVSAQDGNLDINLHLNGAIDYSNKAIAVNINGSGVHQDMSIMGGMQMIINQQGMFSRFENMQATGNHATPFPLPQNQWLKLPAEDSFPLAMFLPRAGNLPEFVELSSISTYLETATINGKTYYHYSLKNMDLANLENLFTGTSKTLGSMLTPQLDYWVNSEQVLTELHGKFHLPADDIFAGGELEISISLDTANPKVTITSPAEAVEFRGDFDTLLPVDLL